MIFKVHSEFGPIKLNFPPLNKILGPLFQKIAQMTTNNHLKHQTFNKKPSFYPFPKKMISKKKKKKINYIFSPYSLHHILIWFLIF